jgi:hypothetical protein
MQRPGPPVRQFAGALGAGAVLAAGAPVEGAHGKGSGIVACEWCREVPVGLLSESALSRISFRLG